MKELFSKTFEGKTAYNFISTITVCELQEFGRGENLLQVIETYRDEKGFQNGAMIFTKETAKNIVKVLNKYFNDQYDYTENVQTDEIEK